MKIVKCNENDFVTLAAIWERSVRASHKFLKEEDFNEIKAALIPDYFPNVDLYAVMENGLLTGFVGLKSDTIEMLFIDSKCRWRGYGSALIDFAKHKGINKVDVNEENPSALNFYKAKGFSIIGRDDTDVAGRPYPILHLSL